MRYSYTRLLPTARFLLSLWLLLAAGAARAQTPAWTGAALDSPSQCYGASLTRAVTTDASGNVFVTGSFTGSVAFGSTVLTCVPGVSPSNGDLFVAKWVPATGTWAWAVRGGGNSDDIGYGIAVSGGSVYVTGYIVNNTANAAGVTLGSAGAASVIVRGASATNSIDLLLAKYTDQGSSAALAWVQVAGGTSEDTGYGVAVQGSSVYVTGTLTSSTANANAVLFGGDGTTAGTVPVNGASATSSLDLVLAKYTDLGSRATVAWTQVGGGSGDDFGNGVAVSGSRVYVAGGYTNDQGNSRAVVVGGGGTTAGTVALRGASGAAVRNLLLACYADQGPTGAYAWSQVGGSSQGASAQGVAVSGSSVYVAAGFINNTVNATGMVVGGDGTTPGTVPVNGASAITSPDGLLLKYTDQGSTGQLSWNQVSGGTGTDGVAGVAVSGSSVYLSGHYLNTTTNTNTVVFGGSGTTAGTATVPGVSGTQYRDVVLAKYTDLGSTGSYQWSQVGGGYGDDYATGLAVGGGQVYVSGFVSSVPTYSFGPNSAALTATLGRRGLVASAIDGGSTGSWGVLAPVFNGGGTVPRAVATDASGNVFVTGGFSGQVRFGSTVLTSAGNQDLYVAKYVPGTGTWAWAVRGGGAESDSGYGLAVSGSSVYVTGSCYNNAANVSGVTLGDTRGGNQPLGGASSTVGLDLVLAKYTDQGTNAVLAWAQVAGGTGGDIGYGVAVSGSSVYVTGSFANNTADANAVVFGGNGTTAGTSSQAGATATVSSDVVLAKYTDQGLAGAFGWSQVAGGTGFDQGNSVAVSGSSVYVTGSIINSLSNAGAVVFGGSGLAAGSSPQAGATATLSGDVLLAKYTDQGSTGSYVWSQTGGGTSSDGGQSVAVSGSSVYVAGILRNTTANSQAAVFGGGGLAAGTAPQYGASNNGSNDLLLAKYTDQGPTGSFQWSQVAGGTGNDQALGVAAVGSRVYVTGLLSNDLGNSSAVVFGGSGAAAGTAGQAGLAALVGTDVLLARYTDQGPTGTFDWSRVGGSTSADGGYGVAVSGQQVWVAGQVSTPATFGSIPLAAPSLLGCTAVATLLDPALPLPTRAASPGAGLALYPNPSGGAATLTGATPGAAVQVLDALGRLVATAAADVQGAARLAGLAPGFYLVRAGTGSVRLAVE